MDRALIVVAKRPANGQTKTRLTPPLTPTQAVALYEAMLLDTLALMTEVPEVQPVLAYAPEDAEGFFRGISPTGFEFRPQRGASLGERLHSILSECLADGRRQVVVMDSDSPTLPAGHVAAAFERLDDPAVDVVLGPCDDGGYYLVGLKSPCAALFDVTMSTARVLEDTLAAAARAGLRVALLPTWYDVDTVAEVQRLRAELAQTDEAVARRTRACLAGMGTLTPGSATPSGAPQGRSIEGEGS